MTGNDEFNERLARVRVRFAAALDGKIAASFGAAEKLAAGAPDAADAVITTHRLLHEMCGIAPTLGFGATGKAARGAESILRDAARARRTLSADELVALRHELENLRTAAHTERAMEATRG